MIEINFPILIAQVVTFLIAAAILWKIAWGPLYNLLKERSQNIKNGLHAVELAKENVKKLEEEYRLRLGQIQEKANELIEQARCEGAKEKEDLILTARQEAERLIAKTRLQLEEDKKRMIQELRAEVSGLSVAIAEKLLRECMDRNLRDKLFSEALRQMEALEK